MLLLLDGLDRPDRVAAVSNPDAGAQVALIVHQRETQILASGSKAKIGLSEDGGRNRQGDMDQAQSRAA